MVSRVRHQSTAGPACWHLTGIWVDPKLLLGWSLFLFSPLGGLGTSWIDQTILKLSLLPRFQMGMFRLFIKNRHLSHKGLEFPGRMKHRKVVFQGMKADNSRCGLCCSQQSPEGSYGLPSAPAQELHSESWGAEVGVLNHH